MSNIQTIPLDKLRPSPRNVRKTGDGNIEDLAASIAAERLLQNLVVTDAGDGYYEVEDGGRRLRALLQLHAEGRLASTDIPCNVVEREQALEAGLTANIIRQAMHPADEFAAFQQLFREQGKSIEEIAERFGKPEVYIRQRLKLANVAPEFFEMFRTGESRMTLDHLMALALTEDHTAQRTAWENTANSNHSPGSIRSYLTRGKVNGNTAIAQLVGVTDYVAAGGNVERDLFSDTVYFLDPALLDTLALDKLEAKAQELRDAGWSWAEARLTFDYSERAAYPWDTARWDGTEHFATPEDEARHDEICRRMDTIDEIDADDLDEAAAEALRDEWQRLDDERDAINDRKVTTYPPAVMARAGALVYLGNQGIQIEAPKLQPGHKPGNVSQATAGDSTTPAQKPAKKAELSDTMRTTLSAHRSEAARAQIWRDPSLALALLLQRLLASYAGSHDNTGVNITLGRPQEATKVADIHKSLRDQLAEADKLLKDTIKQKPTLETILAMDSATIGKLFAALVTVSFSGITANPHGHAGVAAIHALTQFDMSTNWTPATDDFLGRIPSALVIEAVTEAKGKAAAQPLSDLNKAGRTAEAAKLLGGTGWLPKPLRGPTYDAKAVGGTAPIKDVAKPALKKPAAKKAVPTKAAKKPAKKTTKKAPAKKAAKRGTK